MEAREELKKLRESTGMNRKEICDIICKTFKKVHTISSGELGEIHHEKDRNKTEGYAAICGIE